MTKTARLATVATILALGGFLAGCEGDADGGKDYKTDTYQKHSDLSHDAASTQPMTPETSHDTTGQ